MGVGDETQTFDHGHQKGNESAAHVCVIDELIVPGVVSIQTKLLNVQDRRVSTESQSDVEDAKWIEDWRGLCITNNKE
jgi:hypothetical protein